ncbi:MAG: hypothetical protein LBQ23_03025 [Puniceicoccales bacterium]|nr:hypothetical protein [Puniceicoccales bacterium]
MTQAQLKAFADTLIEKAPIRLASLFNDGKLIHLKLDEGQSNKFTVALIARWSSNMLQQLLGNGKLPNFQQNDMKSDETRQKVIRLTNKSMDGIAELKNLIDGIPS